MRKELVEMFENLDIKEVRNEDNFIILTKSQMRMLSEDEMFAEKYLIEQGEKEREYTIKTLKGAKVENVLMGKQVHNKTGENLKVAESKLVGAYRAKIIATQKKSGVEYRIWVAFKVDGVLTRRRVLNDTIKTIQSDKVKMLAYFDKLTEKQIKEAI